MVYFGGTLYWVTISIREYGGYSGLTSLLILFLLVTYLSVYTGLFCALIQWHTPDDNTLLIFTPALWVVLEWAKGHFFTGFPWASLAYSQTAFLPIIQIADFGGIYAVGFVIMFVNRTVYVTLRRRFDTAPHSRVRIWKPLLIGLTVFLMTLVYGYVRLSEPEDHPMSLTVSVVQGNIPQDQKWDRAFQDQTLETYEQLSLSTLQADHKPKLILWPESALPFVFNSEPDYEAHFRRFSNEKEVHLVIGAPSLGRDASGKLGLRNSAFYFSPGQTQFDQYDKQHLVPFGEYIPFANQLGFMKKLVQGSGDFFPGQTATLFPLGEHPVGTVICFEVIFPEIVRQFVQKGAVLMTNITNDAWFGTSSAPFQHFSMVIFRAIENRVGFARAANTGISGFIDAQGRVLQQTRLFTKSTATARLKPRNQTTLYTRWGDFFALLCGMITGIILLLNILKRRTSHAI